MIRLSTQPPKMTGHTSVHVYIIIFGYERCGRQQFCVSDPNFTKMTSVWLDIASNEDIYPLISCESVKESERDFKETLHMESRVCKV
jgi:hypothetical protein